jgi:nicotinate-nucleotide pyrophosphorylase
LLKKQLGGYIMENRYYVKVRWSPESKQPTRDVSFMVEADSADQIREAIDLKHEIVIIDRVD